MLSHMTRFTICANIYCMHAQCKFPAQNSAISQFCMFTKHISHALTSLGLSLRNSNAAPHVLHCKLPSYRVCRISAAMQPLTQSADNTCRWTQHTRITVLANALGTGTHTGTQNSHSKLATRLSLSPHLGRRAVQGNVTSLIRWTLLC